MKKEKEIKEMQDRHEWMACLALTKAFDNSMGQQQHVDWYALCEAAFHAGAAKALHDAAF